MISICSKIPLKEFKKEWIAIRPPLPPPPLRLVLPLAKYDPSPPFDEIIPMPFTENVIINIEPNRINSQY